MTDHRTVAPASSRKLPLGYSMLSAGPRAEMSEDFELLDVNEMITGGHEGFIAYIVTGTSMVNEIQPGSVVFVNPYAEPRNGQTVVCCVNGVINVKIFEARGRSLYLVPKNPEFDPVRVRSSDDFHILGVVTASLNLHR